MSSKKQLQSCIQCNTPGLYITFPPNDTITCPFCQLQFEPNDNDEFNNFNYCPNCKTIFGVGCMHGMGNHPDNIYNTYVMSGYRYQGQTHEGMLVFDSDASARQFSDLAKRKELQVTFQCSCDGYEFACPKALNPHNKEPHKDKVITYGV